MGPGQSPQGKVQIWASKSPKIRLYTRHTPIGRVKSLTEEKMGPAGVLKRQDRTQKEEARLTHRVKESQLTTPEAGSALRPSLPGTQEKRLTPYTQPSAGSTASGQEHLFSIFTKR